MHAGREGKKVKDTIYKRNKRAISEYRANTNGEKSSSYDMGAHNNKY